ncbi:hypothetical protein ACM66B_002200 [Microbotryomycetes sp. NB124-2]
MAAATAPHVHSTSGNGTIDITNAVALASPGANVSVSRNDETESDPNSKRTIGAALTRALFGTLAFLFKRPIRLFRPVKISTMTGIQAIAEEQGRSVTPAFVRALIRKEGWSFLPRHVLPPLVVNCAIGLTLFTSYSSAESFFSRRLGSSTLVPFLSGSFAGSIQSILSAPLDNARLLLLRRQRLISRYGHRKAARVQGAFTGWPSLIKLALFQQHGAGSTLAANNADGASLQANTSRSGRIAQARQWARRGWSLFTLSLTKDALSFGAFFAVFELGREGARRVGLAMDGLPVTTHHSPSADTSAEDDDEYSVEFDGGTRVSRRSTLSLVVQSFLILVTGGIAGVAFALVARPFERCRGAIWEGRARWAENDGRLQVIKELALKNTPRDARTAQDSLRRPTKIGSARRHAVRIQTVRRRGTGRTFVRAARRRLKAQLFAKHQATLKKRELAVQTLEPVLRTPMPSASSLVRKAMNVYGARTFLFAPTLPWTQSSKARHAPTDARKAASRGPTRLSARSRLPQHSFLKSTGYRVARVLAYVPPYSIGFFAFALMSGDLR